MKKKGKLTKAERFEISILLEKGYSHRKIGEAMGRSPNTVSYEVKTNSVKGVYDPLKADRKARERKRASKFQWRKIDEDKALREYIVLKLRAHWNPDEISGKMREDQEPFFASKTAIYEWLYGARGQRYCHYLYSNRYQKKPRKTKKTSRVMIPDRVSLGERFLGATNRTRYGQLRGGYRRLKERRNRRDERPLGAEEPALGGTETPLDVTG
jgi:IS30 family transposase